VHNWMAFGSSAGLPAMVCGSLGVTGLAMVQIAAMVSVGFMVVLSLAADVLVRSHRTNESR
jgi:hypothetical protein